MNLWSRAFTVVAGASILGAAAWGQSVISARSGIIHYLEGQVFLEEKLVASKFGEFPDIKEGNVFRTGRRPRRDTVDSRRVSACWRKQFRADGGE